MTKMENYITFKLSKQGSRSSKKEKADFFNLIHPCGVFSITNIQIHDSFL